MTGNSIGAKPEKALAMEENKVRKKKRKRRRLLSLIFLLLLLSISVFILVYRANTKVISLANPSQYIQQISGDGVFVFHEYAPSFLPQASADLPKGRIQIGTDLLPVSEEEKGRLNRQLAELENILQAPPVEISDLRMESYETDKDYLEKVIARNQFFMPFSGVLVSHVDGWEGIYTPASLSYLQPEDILLPSQEEIAEQQWNRIKFVDNRNFYLAVRTSQTIEENPLSVESVYSIVVEQDKKLEGKLVQILENTKAERIYVFSFTDDFEEIQDIRFAKVSIIQEEKSSYLLPMESVFEEEKEYYCYIVDQNRTVRRRKVDILDADLERGLFFVDAQSESEGEDEVIYLKKFDQVISHPEGYTEGDLF